MINKPQLSAEMEKRFDDEFPGEMTTFQDGMVRIETKAVTIKAIKHFLATALEEQKVKHWFEMRKRCLLFGCVFGIPNIDKEPGKECIFCGEPGYIDQDSWLNESQELKK